MPPSPTPAPTATLTPTATPTPTPVRPTTLTFEGLAEAPDLDLSDLTRRLGVMGNTGPVAPPPRGTLGEVQSFWVVDLDERRPFRVEAVLRAASAHVDFYLVEGVPVSDATLQQAVESFETEVLPKVTALVGGEGYLRSRPLTFLLAPLPGVAGYYNSLDEYPVSVNPYSNQRSMLYIDAKGVKIGSQEYEALVAHELQHALQQYIDPSEEVWVNEGLSEVAALRTGFGVGGFVRFFQREPTVQLTDWASGSPKTLAHYGAATLFFLYLLQCCPDAGGSLKALVAEPLDGMVGVDSYLRAQGYPLTFRDLVVGWATANHLDGRSTRDFYAGWDVAVPATATVVVPEKRTAQASQFSAYYAALDLPPGDYTLSFQGAERVPVAPLLPPPGRGYWWSLPGDAVDETLTLPLDLSPVAKATLRLRLWYDIEEEWDYAYLLVSTDECQTWRTLETSHTSSRNPVGQSFGPGYTGRSGGGEQPAWIDDTVDLTPYAGRKVLLRLEHTTDSGIHWNGIAIGEVEVPETGYRWRGDDAGTWAPMGFLFSNGWARQEFEVRLLLVDAEGSPTVLAVPLDGANQGHVRLEGLGSRFRHAALMVVPLAPATFQPASFSYEVATG
ncbi:MAG: immune inhibitor A [Chloroflexi bacterium]|nr:immune inhibitor A [Chloroflexota bacterium]